LKKALNRLAEMRNVYPQTAVYFDHTEPWGDGWVGPRLVVLREAADGEWELLIQGWIDLRYMSKPLVLTVYIDGWQLGQQQVEQSGNFALRFPLHQPLLAGPHTVEVQASTWFVPHRFTRNRDFRPLAFRLARLEFQRLR